MAVSSFTNSQARQRDSVTWNPYNHFRVKSSLSKLKLWPDSIANCNEKLPANIVVDLGYPSIGELGSAAFC